MAGNPNVQRRIGKRLENPLANFWQYKYADTRSHEIDCAVSKTSLGYLHIGEAILEELWKEGIKRRK